MPSAGFEPAIPVSEQPKTHALKRVATGNGRFLHWDIQTSENDRSATGFVIEDVSMCGKFKNFVLEKR
jgi:hypothetical protein